MLCIFVLNIYTSVSIWMLESGMLYYLSLWKIACCTAVNVHFQYFPRAISCWCLWWCLSPSSWQVCCPTPSTSLLLPCPGWVQISQQWACLPYVLKWVYQAVCTAWDTGHRAAVIHRSHVGLSGCQFFGSIHVDKQLLQSVTGNHGITFSHWQEMG